MLKLFIFWITLIPFIVWQSHFEGPKVFYLFSGSILLLLFWIARVWKYGVLAGEKNFNFLKADYFFLSWLFILFIASLFGVHPLESILGGSYRHQGVIFFLALWLIGKTVGILNEKDKKLLLKSVGLSVLIESCLVVFQFLSGHLYFGKSLGTLGEANAVAGFLGIGSYFVQESFPRIFLIVPGISIILELSRSGIASFLPNTFIFFEKNIRKFSKPLLSILFVASIIFVLFVSYTKKVSPFENRLLFGKMAVESIIQRPLLGFGAESGEVVYNEAFKKYEMPLNNLIVDRAHNLFLDVAMWSGIVGLIMFSLWLYQSFKDASDLSKKYALLSFLIYSMFQPLSIVHWILVIIIVNI